MKNKSVKFITQSAVIAAIYTVGGCFFVYAPNSFFMIRFTEAMTVLPCFMPSAVPGLFVGCVLTNILTGCAPWDVVFGSLATLIGALGTYVLRKYKWLAIVPPILSNTLILPFVFKYVYGDGTIRYLMLSVGVGEIVSCGILGTLLTVLLSKYKNQLKL